MKNCKIIKNHKRLHDIHLDLEKYIHVFGAFSLDFDILSEPFIEHLLRILLNLNHILLFTH